VLWNTARTDPEADPTITELRDQIRRVDRALLAAVNERIGLVAELKRYKGSQGIDFVDRAQEERVIAELTRDNDGPLSPEGVRALYDAVFELIKREVP
jgi:chorismate mutase/prephenate dehydratase